MPVCLNACRQIQSARDRLRITAVLIAETQQRLLDNARAHDHVQTRYVEDLHSAHESVSRFECGHRRLMERSTATVWTSEELLRICSATIEESRRRIERRARPRPVRRIA